MEEDDAALVAGICEGSDRAFNLLIDRHQKAVRSFLRRLLASEADADDVAQDTFVAAWEGARRYRGTASVRSWLCAIAWRKAKTAQRTWHRSRRRETTWQEMAPGEDEPPEEALDRIAVKQALLTLSLDQRAAVTLCFAEGFSHREAAKALGIPLGTLKSHVARGRARLLEALGGNSDDPWQGAAKGGEG